MGATTKKIMEISIAPRKNDSNLELGGNFGDNHSITIFIQLVKIK